MQQGLSECLSAAKFGAADYLKCLFAAKTNKKALKDSGLLQIPQKKAKTEIEGGLAAAAANRCRILSLNI